MFDDNLQRSVSVASTPAPIIDYSDFASYLSGLKICSLLFVPDSPNVDLAQLSPFAGRAQLHKLTGGGVCLSATTLQPTDLRQLRSMCSSVLIRRMGADLFRNFRGETPMEHMAALGFRIFFEHGSDGGWITSLRRYRLIGLAEFGLSSAARLLEYPAVSHGLSYGISESSDDAPIRTVFILDLIQDFDILRPLLLRCATSPQWRDLYVSVSELVNNSHIWVAVEHFLKSLRIPWFRPTGPLDTANALGSGKSILITASESTASNHRFCHEVCRLAPTRTIKLTMQHGYECVGLKHHQGHDRHFPNGIRFASDFVFTWSNPDTLPNLHPGDHGKCIPVGVTKAISEEIAAHTDHQLHHKHVSSPRKAAIQTIFLPRHSPLSLLIAENLHSVRFTEPARYKRFLDFILDANHDKGFAVTLRSHPAMRTLQKHKDAGAFAFLEGELRASALADFDFFVSPPSTIVLDAVLSGVPAAVWSDQPELGDCENYAGIPSVCDLENLNLLCRDRDSIDHIRLNNYRWATQSVCAFNGVPQAWSRLNELARP